MQHHHNDNLFYQQFCKHKLTLPSFCVYIPWAVFVSVLIPWSLFWIVPSCQAVQFFSRLLNICACGSGKINLICDTLFDTKTAFLSVCTYKHCGSRFIIAEVTLIAYHWKLNITHDNRAERHWRWCSTCGEEERGQTCWEAVHVFYFSPSLNWIQKILWGAEHGNCPVGVGAAVHCRFRVHVAGEDMIGFGYSNDSNGMNRVSMSGVAEIMGDKRLAAGEGVTDTERGENGNEPVALDWKWRHQDELMVFNI